MQPQPPTLSIPGLDAFIALAGARAWRPHGGDRPTRHVRAARRAGGPSAPRRWNWRSSAARRARSPALRRRTAGGAACRRRGGAVADSSRAPGAARLRERLHVALAGDGTLVPVFHMLRTAALQRSRGFRVALRRACRTLRPYDLLIARGALEAEIACDVVSAEEGRLVHRGAWSAWPTGSMRTCAPGWRRIRGGTC